MVNRGGAAVVPPSAGGSRQCRACSFLHLCRRAERNVLSGRLLLTKNENGRLCSSVIEMIACLRPRCPSREVKRRGEK